MQRIVPKSRPPPTPESVTKAMQRVLDLSQLAASSNSLKNKHLTHKSLFFKIKLYFPPKILIPLDNLSLYYSNI